MSRLRFQGSSIKLVQFTKNYSSQNISFLEFKLMEIEIIRIGVEMPNSSMKRGAINQGSYMTKKMHQERFNLRKPRFEMKD